MSESVRKYVTEFIGAFFLVFTVVTAVTKNAPLAPLGIGAALMVMVFAGGHISGAHYNPAVSIAVFLRGRLDASDLLPYIGAQLLGGLLASLIGRWIFSPSGGPAAVTGKQMWVALVVEILFTFALAYVVLNVATSKDHPDNSFYGLAIGFTVAAGAVAVGPLSGAVFNPAVGLGVTIADMSAWGNIWIYLIGPVLGAAAAAMTFKALNPTDV